MKQKQNKKPKMTLDKLAQITADGFSELKNDLTNEFDNKINGLRTELKGDINELKIEVNELKDKVEKGINKMYTLADSMASQFSDWKQENAFGAGIEQRQDERLEDHEIRIGKLEKV